MSWHIPTVGDLTAVRQPWPAELQIVTPDAAITGDYNLGVLCPDCRQPREPGDLCDLRGAGDGFRCTHCLHHQLLLAGGGWHALAVALGCLDATALASYLASDAALALPSP